MFKYILALTLYICVNTDLHAQRGCCSHHKGVQGCNNETGYLMCRDGTESPSCTCPKAKSSHSRNTENQAYNNDLKDYLLDVKKEREKFKEKVEK